MLAFSCWKRLEIRFVVAMAALKPEQVMSPTAPMATPLESGEATRGGSRSEDVSSLLLDPSLGGASFHGGQQGLPNGAIGVAASFVAGGAADVVPQTTVQGGGRQQGPEAAPRTEDLHQGLLSSRTAMPRHYGAADAGIQAVAIREPEVPGVAVDSQAGAGITRSEANAAAFVGPGQRTQYGTPNSSRTAWADDPKRSRTCSASKLAMVGETR